MKNPLATGVIPLIKPIKQAQDETSQYLQETRNAVALSDWLEAGNGKQHPIVGKLMEVKWGRSNSPKSPGASVLDSIASPKSPK